MINVRPIDRDIDVLLPPSVQDWLPEGHLARGYAIVTRLPDPNEVPPGTLIEARLACDPLRARVEAPGSPSTRSARTTTRARASTHEH